MFFAKLIFFYPQGFLGKKCFINWHFFAVDEGAIIDAVFDSFRNSPPSGFDRIMVEKALLWGLKTVTNITQWTIKRGKKVQKSFNFWSKHGCRFTIQLSTAPGKKGKFCCPGRLLSKIEKWIPAFYHQKPGFWLADLAVQPIKGLVFGEKWLEFISLSQIKCDYNFSVASLNCTM